MVDQLIVDFFFFERHTQTNMHTHAHTVLRTFCLESSSSQWWRCNVVEGVGEVILLLYFCYLKAVETLMCLWHPHNCSKIWLKCSLFSYSDNSPEQSFSTCGLQSGSRPHCMTVQTLTAPPEGLSMLGCVPCSTRKNIFSWHRLFDWFSDTLFLMKNWSLLSPLQLDLIKCSFHRTKRQSSCSAAAMISEVGLGDCSVLLWMKAVSVQQLLCSAGWINLFVVVFAVKETWQRWWPHFTSERTVTAG